MNGVRRLLGATTNSPPSPLIAEIALPPPTPPTPPLNLTKSAAGPSWPPLQTPSFNPGPTPSLFIRKDKQKPQPPLPGADGDTGNAAPTVPLNGRSSPAQAPSSATLESRVLPSLQMPRKPPPDPDSWPRPSGALHTRDELLVSLLASDAVIDSRDCDILSSEEVDELKKEHQVLSSRLGAMSKKLTLETKIRDAAVSLSKVNAPHKKLSKQTAEQLDAATRRVDAAQRELWRVADRANDIHKRLLEHRAGVLSLSVRNMEKKMAAPPLTLNGPADDSGYDSSNRSTLMSPTTSSMTGVSSSSQLPRFDGAHLFAGHADAVVPKRPFSADDAAAEIAALETKLKAAADALTAAGKKQVALTRELAMVRLEKEEVETVMGMELQGAGERIEALEHDLPRLQGLEDELAVLRDEKRAWEAERRAWEDRVQAAEARAEAQRRGKEEEENEDGKLVEELRVRLEAKERELGSMMEEWDAERAAWEGERAQMEDERMDDLARLQEEMDAMRAMESGALEKANVQLDNGLAALRTLVTQHAIVLFSRDASLQGLLGSVGTHLETMHARLGVYKREEAEWETLRRKLEADVRSGMDKRETLVRELEEARRERDDAWRQSRALKDHADFSRSSVHSSSTALTDESAALIIAALQPVWNVLPSPEVRAAKFGRARPFRAGSPTPGGTAGGTVTSLSDLDVRSLKTLYDARPGQQGAPMSPVAGGGGVFSVEAFTARVQALLADDRALIERLVRFAQAHDLLKRNAERAQKLAQEGTVALETYQRQVRTMEERNMAYAARQAAMQEEMQQLQDAMERVCAEKSDVESLAAEQAETCRQLTEANNTLSARTLTLAEEAAAAPERVRRVLEGQLADTRAALQAAQDEVDAMRMSEQSQRIALLDELNTMQTENGVLRAQLRAARK